LYAAGFSFGLHYFLSAGFCSGFKRIRRAVTLLAYPIRDDSDVVGVFSSKVTVTLSAYPVRDSRFEISARFRVLVSRTVGSRDLKSSRETKMKERA